MALNRINGPEELFVGGVFGVNRVRHMQENNITHVLSVINFSLDKVNEAYSAIEHMSIDIDDMEDQDILVHLPKMVRFIERGLYGSISPPSPSTEQAEVHKEKEEGKKEKGAVLVHCAMGKSRSVTAVVAYLLWKHPHRFGRSDPSTTAKDAVQKAVEWVRQTRPIAEPNEGFMEQLEMFYDMGCPAESDDAVEKHPVYQRWLYKREVESATAIGRAPDWIRFEDEASTENKEEEKVKAELRCKKCRRVLATERFLVPHQGRGNEEKDSCGHYFIEALSWMKGTLELGELEGRLNCPNAKCGSSVGRYSWRGFKCSCGDWVAPAFSLQSSKVDKVV
ncbi:tyrosine-protein phosphatase, partial [Podospora australis]